MCINVAPKSFWQGDPEASGATGNLQGSEAASSSGTQSFRAPPQRSLEQGTKMTEGDTPRDID